ncbi:hypothetical protein [Dictyobacter formicarum]|uniref:DUF2933 domain-containing protein n=1 Tax=Dictyobacter formicarum TaxID=2778368 RepID=A0ABQ3V9U5_9CHLR|nr:hypothetical protein [Dictyobacter formicarum]GHO82554.1 hypothetical protein KSZ_05600 [Dictyobacter formicarum]
MQNLLLLLPVLACPVGMRLLMWLMMRMGKEQIPSDAGHQPEERQRAVVPEGTREPSTSLSEPAPSPLKAIWNCMQMCLNWKVLVGLTLVALLVGVVAPHFLWAALPMLLVLGCPLSMIIMMVSMSRRRENALHRAISCSGCEPRGAEPAQMLEQPERERSSAEVKW